MRQHRGWLTVTRIFYAATELEAAVPGRSHVFLLGEGNSAGQAALYLARRPARVTIKSMTLSKISRWTR